MPYHVRVARWTDDGRALRVEITSHMTDDFAGNAIAIAKLDLAEWLRDQHPRNPHAEWNWLHDGSAPVGAERHVRGVFGPYTCEVSMYPPGATVPGI